MSAQRIIAFHYILGGLHEQLAHENDGRVRGSKSFLRAIEDRAHRLLERHVLGVDTDNAGEVGGSLDLAVQAPIVALVLLQLKGARNVVLHASARAVFLLLPFFIW